MRGCSASSRSPAASRATSRPRRPGSIHEGGELGYALVARLRRGVRQPGPARAVRRRRRRGRDRPAGRELALEQVPRPGARRRRAAGPAPQRLQDRQPDRARAHPAGRAARADDGLRPRAACSSRATSPRRCTRRWRPRSTASLDEIAEIQRRARADGDRRAAALADDRPAHAEGLDRARRRSTACRSRARGARTRCRSPQLAEQPRAPARSSRQWMRSYRPGGAVRRARRARGPSCSRWRRRASAAWAPTRTPTAACCCSDLRLPDFRDYAVDVPAPAATLERGDARAGRVPARRHARSNPRRRSASSGPTRRRRTGSARVFEVTDRAWMAERSAGDDHLAPDGRVMEVLSEHLCQGWLEGYLLTGRHGLFNCYEAFIHIVDSMFNQHAKWLKVTRDDPVAAADRVAELPAHLARLAPGPQRLLPPGPGLHRPRGQQEGRDHPRLPAAGRQLPAVGRRPLPAQPPLRQRDRGRQAAGARLPDDGRGDRALHARPRHLGLGVDRRRRASPTSCSAAPATSRRSRRSPPPRCCASTCPS